MIAMKARCLSVACDREKNGEPLCDKCIEAHEIYLASSERKLIETAIQTLESRGFVVLRPQRFNE